MKYGKTKIIMKPAFKTKRRMNKINFKNNKTYYNNTQLKLFKYY